MRSNVIAVAIIVVSCLALTALVLFVDANDRGSDTFWATIGWVGGLVGFTVGVIGVLVERAGGRKER